MAVEVSGSFGNGRFDGLLERAQEAKDAAAQTRRGAEAIRQVVSDLREHGLRKELAGSG